jgi:hypothetical protein
MKTKLPGDGPVTLEGAMWKCQLSRAEWDAWDVYADNHEHLVVTSYKATLDMFLNHFRRGIDLNVPVAKSIDQPLES